MFMMSLHSNRKPKTDAHPCIISESIIGPRYISVSIFVPKELKRGIKYLERSNV